MSEEEPLRFIYSRSELYGLVSFSRETALKIHHVKIGFREHETRMIGMVMKKERRQCGIDGGSARNQDDKYWFDHLVLRKDDGELTSLTMDEYTQLKRLQLLIQTD